MPLLGPVADKLGIDLIWFGILLAVNMQTSFMHPPFGFALFYLRSVAPVSPYKDHVTGKTMEPVTTGQIYWGSIPFVCIQIVMVSLIIAFPQLVGHDKPVATDGAQVIDIQQMLQEDAAADAGSADAAEEEPPEDAVEEDAPEDAEEESPKVSPGAAPSDNAGDALTRAIREAGRPAK